MRCLRFSIAFYMLTMGAIVFAGPDYAIAASAAEINRDARAALEMLYKKSPIAKALAEKANAVLVFPRITKGGFIVGGQYGEGVLLEDGKAVSYYNTVSASYGLQAGLQRYGYALFLMTGSMRSYLDKSGGWELGMAPNIVIVDVGAAGGISTTTAQSDAYAFFFNQKGLMAGLGLQGTKITKIEK
ncbi:MAG TPA: lipid-binding SYLF domain-containing protein [Syntrophorhabdaceae bacterium]